MKCLLLFLLLGLLSCSQEIIAPIVQKPDFTFIVRDLGDQLNIEYSYISPGYTIKYGPTVESVYEETTSPMHYNTIRYSCNWTMSQNSIHYIHLISGDGLIDTLAGPFY
jgi:hypothetical protein